MKEALIRIAIGLAFIFGVLGFIVGFCYSMLLLQNAYPETVLIVSRWFSAGVLVAVLLAVAWYFGGGFRDGF